MQIFIRDSYAEISALAASHFVEILSGNQHPLVCVASGDSPSGLYKQLVALKNAGKLNVQDWNFIGLDEWLGMNGNDEGSCRYHLDQQFFNPMQIDKGKIRFFDGRATDLQGECDVVEDTIKNKGGVDLAILGLGLNGHIGMNEPGTDIHSRAHIAQLEEETVKVGQKYFTTAKELTGGLTMGIASIMDSRNVFLIVNGTKKAGIVKRLLEEPVSAALPASILRNHPGARIYLDREAASQLANI
ncbi:glucosamine-6-phosphate deaminase [Flavihumibacter fluvii]|uniref:glucosamine-6-phosphate deaminase n=1 Tax=Flavihumibacter fluvii TaxID=2838157 RepID=UPI001BDF01C1|nr:glucosamine-6-phosphate deaminase [Flavihumibacter fluvii]ULQ53618.1 glucosamine-6-phosphate deaminase [Flavihumibacter fluvii]